jgi:Excreted virulence factor EspC, type VII ESX diderm
MSLPLPPERSPAEPISVQPAALEALAAELSALASALSEDADRCRSAAHAVSTALGGHEGLTARDCVTAWASLEEVLVDGARSLGSTLSSTAARYADEDYSLAARIRTGLTYGAPGSRAPSSR